MSRPLSVLIVEDSPDDGELLLLELARRGYAVTSRRVETADAMRAALAEGAWDLVLSDYCLPNFSAVTALAVLRDSGLDIPFIIVSGTIGEETAVAALKAGAHDFVVKTQLARLAPAIERELREAEVRRRERAVELALRSSEERFRTIMDTATDAVISADATGRILTVNPATEAMFGYTAQELLGQPLSCLMPEGLREAHEGGLARFLETGSPTILGRKVEFVGRRKDGSEFPLDLSLGTWVSNGESYFAGFLQDISDRKRFEAQLLIADRLAAVGILAAGVAHEINNPLSAVIASLELAGETLARARRGGAGAARLDRLFDGLAERLGQAEEAAERVRHTVRDLKIFARGEDEKHGPVDVRAVMESTLRMAWNEIRHRARLVKRYDEVPLVMASEARLGQVFLNIVVNAAQALAEVEGNGNEIRISIGSRAGRVFVEIADTGPGIAPDVLKRLFTPFVTTKPVGVGTGLGLSICQRIMSDLGGEIEVETAMGKGTAFRLSLPPALAPPEPVPAPVRPTPVSAGARGRVLVIDDEPLVAELAEAALRSDHDVVTLQDARVALDRVRRGERFDVILCDLMMPEMTGMELYENLCREIPEQAARVIFLTGGAFTQRARAFLDQSSVPHIEKPFKLGQLRSTVNEHVRRGAAAPAQAPAEK